MNREIAITYDLTKKRELFGLFGIKQDNLNLIGINNLSKIEQDLLNKIISHSLQILKKSASKMKEVTVILDLEEYVDASFQIENASYLIFYPISYIKEKDVPDLFFARNPKFRPFSEEIEE